MVKLKVMDHGEVIVGIMVTLVRVSCKVCVRFPLSSVVAQALCVLSCMVRQHRP